MGTPMEDHATATVWMYMPEGMTDVAVKGNLSPNHQPQAKISNYLRGGKKTEKNKTKRQNERLGVHESRGQGRDFCPWGKETGTRTLLSLSRCPSLQPPTRPNYPAGVYEFMTIETFSPMNFVTCLVIVRHPCVACRYTLPWKCIHS